MLDQSEALAHDLGITGRADRLATAVIAAIVAHGILDSREFQMPVEVVRRLSPQIQKTERARQAAQDEADAEREAKRLADPTRASELLQRRELPLLRERAKSFRSYRRRQTQERIRESLEQIAALAAKLPDDERERVEVEVTRITAGLTLAA